MGNRANANLSTTKQRANLDVQPKPHLTSIAAGRLLGYVAKAGEEAGSWVVRVEVKDEQGRRLKAGGVHKQKFLGLADDIVGANGVDILDFEQARDRAAKWDHKAEVATGTG